VLGHSFQSHRATSSKDAPRRREPPRRILGELLCTGFEDFLGRCVCAWRCVAVSAARHRQEFESFELRAELQEAHEMLNISVHQSALGGARQRRSQ
ncbi:unnamed protein product, partial [Polarella glacialis]